MTIKEVLVLLLKSLAEEEKNIMEEWARGSFTGPNDSETIQLNSKALGIIDGIGVSKTVINEMMEDMEQYD